ncbi:sulfite exporter TauE/SafE family protein [Burkholderia contaminans]|uniref:sulfite exporter TauE/SafE family protein n=1 Tax=Burkholderia contaminans TaxID=488447 RepID=UPI001CA9C1B5|nr:sulfite exporter TauE/SafE family protein [Burkholderia contaminans]UAC75691.1 sulfite exporter TauE/SafE family protein [Burkholderia contaminans]
MATPAAMGLQLTLATILIAFAGVFVIAFMRGAFGGGFAIIGIPLLSLVMDPVTAGGLLAPLFIAMDLFALRYWKPSTWSSPTSCCSCRGWWSVSGSVTWLSLPRPSRHRAFDGGGHAGLRRLWVRGGAEPTVRPRSSPKAVSAGLASGVTTMVAHSGGPPLAMYLLPLGLSKEMYAGTTSLFFTVGNAIKAVPWLLIVQPTANVWALMAVCLLAIPAGVVFGWRLHGRLDQRLIYRSCYGLLAVTALKLLWDGVSGYLA